MTTIAQSMWLNHLSPYHTADTRFVSDWFSASRDARACALMSQKKVAILVPVTDGRNSSYGAFEREISVINIKGK